jgi:ankyrin repeat protein
MIRELAAHGAEVNARSAVHDWERDVTAEPRRKYMPRGGWTPLLFAAREGSYEAARTLVEAGADLDLQDPDLVPPVVTAILNGHYDVAKLLVERGADVNRADRWGRAALWAVVDMHTPAASGRPDARESESVSSTDLIDLLLAHGADPNAQLALFPPYRSLADRGNDNLLTIGATPLVRAAKAVDLVAMRKLLARGADVHVATADGITPLLAAAGVGSRDSDTRGRYRTERDAVEAVKMLLDAGAGIRDADGRGQTAVHGAAFWGYTDLVRLLAARGAALDTKDRRGMTPIDSAMGRAGGNGFGGNRIDVHADTAKVIEELIAQRAR